MENITEWAGKIEKNTRNRPNKQLQEELFNRVITALCDGSNSYDDCVGAFCRFDARVIEPFYRDCYWKDIPDKKQWDEAFIRWANTRKPTIPATIRIVAILQEKLRKISSLEEVLLELEWLSMHEDDRSISAYRNMSKKSKKEDLRKLLDLDMREWKIGQHQIEKMFGILFSESTDPQTIQLYQEFLQRHGFSSQSTSEINHESEQAAETECIAAQETIIPPEPSDPIQPETQPVQPVVATTEPRLDGTPGESAHVKKKEMPSDGVVLAEALVKWAYEQKDRVLDLETKLADTNTALIKVSKYSEEQKTRISELENLLFCLRKEKNELEEQLAVTTQRISALETEKAAAQETIGRVQLMSGNSVKQELDGFKHSLGSELSKTVKDFDSDVSDLTDMEKVELYRALLDELLDTLKHNGIIIEEN